MHFVNGMNAGWLIRPVNPGRCVRVRHHPSRFRKSSMHNDRPGCGEHIIQGRNSVQIIMHTFTNCTALLEGFPLLPPSFIMPDFAR